MSDLLLMSSLGLPRSGLVGLYDPYRDTYGRNVLPAPLDGCDAGWGGMNSATLTQTVGQADPDGGVNAKRLTTTGGTTVYKAYVTASATSVSGAVYHVKIWVRNNGAKTVTFRLLGSGTAYDVAVASGVSQWITTSIIGNGSTVVDIRWMVPGVDDTLDITVYATQVNLVRLHPYSAPAGESGTLQTCADYHGGIYPLQLGSGATGDASDPAFSGVSMIHAADYLLSGNLSGVTMAGDWTLPFLCKPSGTANTLVSLASAAAADQYQAVEYNGSTKVRIKTCNGETPVTSDDLTVSNSTVQLLMLTSSGDTLTLKNMATGASVTATNADPTGAPRLCVGALGVSTVASPADALEWHYLPLYGRAWGAPEATRAYLHLKSLMAKRGVTVA